MQRVDVTARASHAIWMVPLVLFGLTLVPLWVGVEPGDRSALAWVSAGIAGICALLVSWVLRVRRTRFIRIANDTFSYGPFRQSLESIRRYFVMRHRGRYVLVLEFPQDLLAHGSRVVRDAHVIDGNKLAIDLYNYPIREQRAVVNALLATIPGAEASAIKAASTGVSSDEARQ